MRKLLLTLIFAAATLSAEPWYHFTMDVDGGFSAILNNQYQSGRNGTLFSFTDDGKQSFLFPNWRASLGLSIYNTHDVEFTYQPVFLDSSAVGNRDLKFDNITIAANSPFQARYYFPFYRVSYSYRLFSDTNFLWSIGLGLQMRSVSIAFVGTEQNASNAFVQTNIGPVPLLLTRMRYDFENYLFVGLDAAGWWSPVPIANGSDKATTGWIYDVALKGGVRARDWLDVYFSTRLIGGGADGDGSERPSGEKYTYNMLNALNFTTGLTFKI